MSRFAIPRRTLLRGVGRGLGVALALPLLEQMSAAEPSPRAGAKPAAPAPTRMAVLFFPNGVPPKSWQLGATGALGALSPILSPLEALKSEVLVLSKFTHKATHSGDGHYFKDAPFLTGTTIAKTTGADINVGGVSLDQLVAQQLGHQTRLPSLELAIEGVPSGVDNNVSVTRVYAGHISWSTPTTPVARENDPQAAFDRLFRVRPAAPAGAKGPAVLTDEDEGSLLDAVQADANSLKWKLGSADQRKLDEYLSAVRDVERRLQADIRAASKPRKIDPGAMKALPLLAEQVKRAPRTDGSSGHQQHVRNMLDIMALAFWTDTTRVATFMFGNSVSGMNYGFIPGVGYSHHESSHHENKADKLASYEKISTWHVQQLAYFLDRLKTITEGEGSLLDHSMVLFGSGLADGNAHSPRDLPIVLAGRGNGAFSPGRHIAAAGKQGVLADVMLEMGRGMGLELKSFADGVSGLPELKKA